jgi:hypothetical protein
MRSIIVVKVFPFFQFLIKNLGFLISSVRKFKIFTTVDEPKKRMLDGSNVLYFAVENGIQ